MIFETLLSSAVDYLILGCVAAVNCSQLICVVSIVSRHHYRLLQAEMRARFDEHKDERDLIKAQKILEDAENQFEELKHPQPIICMLCFE